MDQDSKEKSLQRLAKSRHISIFCEVNSGLDGLAATLALYLSLKKLGKNITVFAKAPTVSDAQKLYGVDAVSQGTDKSDNLVIVIDDAIDNVDKVSYFLEKNQLKIIVHPLPESKGIDENKIAFEHTALKADLIFAVGFEDTDSLKQQITHEQLLDSDSSIVAISKNGLNLKIAQSTFANPDASGLSEITAGVIQELSLPIDEDISYNLYAGITDSTDHFSPSKASLSTFQVGAWLVKFGAGKASFAYSKLQEPKDLIIDPPPPIQFEEQTQTFPETAPEEIEIEKVPPEADWFKPPKVYKGSKSVDTKH